MHVYGSMPCLLNTNGVCVSNSSVIAVSYYPDILMLERFVITTVNELQSNWNFTIIGLAILYYACIDFKNVFDEISLQHKWWTWLTQPIRSMSNCGIPEWKAFKTTKGI